ncbi:head GIN domain-containing protein, partial [Sandarakinorhabdus sp.]|uniref:head GIN domain-containing protein n=1 Tax=Sandarakinorhabdus sp. TaxID=1916663 RepID=UPI00286E7877
KVAVSGSDNVNIRTGNSFAVVATGEQDDLDRLEIKVEGGQLSIGRKSGNWRWGGKNVVVSVTMPALRGLALAGSSDVTADKGAADVFDAKLSGSGDMSVASLDAKTANISVSGSGNVTMAGRCGAQNISIAGSGDVDLSRLACVNSSIRIAGSGNVMARASGDASIRIAGSGDVVVTGGAKCVKKIAGSGDVRCS